MKDCTLPVYNNWVHILYLVMFLRYSGAFWPIWGTSLDCLSRSLRPMESSILVTLSRRVGGRACLTGCFMGFIFFYLFLVG